MPAYFMYSKALKEQLTTMDLTSIIMLITADVTSMYTNIQTRPALNQIVQYLNGNKTKYPSQLYAQSPLTDYEKQHFLFW